MVVVRSALSLRVAIIVATIWGTTICWEGGLVNFLDGRDNYLRAWLNSLFSEWRVHIAQLVVVRVLHWLPIRTALSVCIVEKKLIDDTLILYRQL